MRYWDSSAIVPLLMAEAATDKVRAHFETDPGIVTWWATDVECVSAIARRERDGSLDAPAVAMALHRLSEAKAAWSEIQPQPTLRPSAIRLLRVHPLRAGDALQLAAAIAAADGQPSTLGFVTLDDRLADAAEREGFPVVLPTA